MAKDAARLDRIGGNIYFSLNPTIEDLSGRAQNHVMLAETKKCTTDEQIIAREWLFVDIDAAKGLSDIAATDEQHESALLRAFEIRSFLMLERNWPPPVVVDSGNGAYLLFPIALENNVANTGLVERVLKALAAKFDDHKARIDTGVFNPSRIARIPGTVNRKGDNTASRPHRRCQIIESPEEIEPVSREQLEQIAALGPCDAASRNVSSGAANDLGSFANASHELKKVIEALQEKHQITASDPTRYKDSGWQYVLSACLFNPGHAGDSSVCIIEFDGGHKLYSCLHEPECRENNRSKHSWGDVRGKLGLAEKKTVAGFQLTKLCDLLATEFPPDQYLLEKRLVVGTVSLAVAKPKVGKSTLARNLAIKVARGEEFLGLKTRKGPVIYLALEERAQEIQKDFKAMGADGTEEIYVHAAPSPVEGLRHLIDLVRERKPALVVIDPIFRFTKVKDEKAYAEIYNALGPLIDLARESDTHILMTHHSGKLPKTDPVDSPLGSTALAGIVATLISLVRGENYRTIQTVQRVGDEDMPASVLLLDKATRLLTLGKSKEIVDQHVAEQRILEFLDASGEPQTQAQIRESAECATQIVRAALTSLVTSKRVERSGEGKKGKPYYYGLWFSGSDLYQKTRRPESGETM
jgi:hypothetical protein